MSRSDDSQQPIRPSGSFYIGPIEVDCSTWDAIEGEVPGPSLPIRSLAVNVPTQVLDFIEPKSIEIVMNVAECESKEAAFKLAMDLICSVTQAAPDLKLLYDPDRTRQEAGQVTIVLTPQVYLKDDEKLKELVERINSSPKIGLGESESGKRRVARIVSAAA